MRATTSCIYGLVPARGAERHRDDGCDSISIVDLTDSYRGALPATIVERFEVRETRNAAAVLAAADRPALDEITKVLQGFWLTREDVLGAGGEKSGLAKRLDEAFRELGWREAQVTTRIVLEARRMPYRPAGETTAEVHTSEVLNEGYKTDNLKGRVALDLEWNAKDGNLDRDLAAYRSLYESALIDVAVMITRTGQDMRDLARGLDPETKKFMTSTTTNLEKLEPRLTRGDAGGCPVLAIAISSRCFSPTKS